MTVFNAKPFIDSELVTPKIHKRKACKLRIYLMTKERSEARRSLTLTYDHQTFHRFHMCLQTALDNFPEISVVTELKKDGETPAFKVRLSGKAYNKKTMKPYKMPNKVPQVR